MTKSFDCFVGSMKIHTHVVFPILRHDRQFRTIEIQIDVYVGTVGHPCLPSAETVLLHRARRARVNAGQSLEQSAFQLALLPPHQILPGIQPWQRRNHFTAESSHRVAAFQAIIVARRKPHAGLLPHQALVGIRRRFLQVIFCRVEGHQLLLLRKESFRSQGPGAMRVRMGRTEIKQHRFSSLGKRQATCRGFDNPIGEAKCPRSHVCRVPRTPIEL